jgi:hypothetical protein
MLAGIVVHILLWNFLWMLLIVCTMKGSFSQLLWLWA